MAVRNSYGKITSYLPPSWARELLVTPTAGRVEVRTATKCKYMDNSVCVHSGIERRVHGVGALNSKTI